MKELFSVDLFRLQAETKAEETVEEIFSTVRVRRWMSKNKAKKLIHAVYVEAYSEGGLAASQELTRILDSIANRREDDDPPPGTV